MPTSQELDAVVRRVEPPVAVDSSCQVLVPIDNRTGQPVRPGFWAALQKKHRRHFLITNSHRSGAVAVRRDLRIGIEDFVQGWRFDLTLDYEARCNPGREVRVAQALWNGASPQERLETLLRNGVVDGLRGCAVDFVRDFERTGAALAAELRARAFEQTGLTLEIRLLLAEVDRLDPLHIGPLAFPLSVGDCDDQVELQLEAELAVEPGKERVAFLYRNHHEGLVQAFERTVREHFAARVTLQQFHAELAGSVQRELWRRLDEFVEPYGRRIVRLSLGGEAFPGVVESTRVEHEFSHRLRDYPEPVEVRTEVLLQLADLGSYVRAKAPELESWADREVEQTTVQCLFGVSYTDLCLQYEEKKAEIERQMKERAATIGYELKQLITITDLQFDVLRRPFVVQVEGEFPTRLARLKVCLEVNATLFVPHPSEIASLLDRRVDVKEQIRLTLLDRIQQRLHQVDPESFYMEFETAEGKPSVRAQLETLIAGTLEEEFRAKVLTLSCKQLETELSQRLVRLMAPLHEFSVGVVASRGGPSVIFDGSFRVTGVDESGWIAFQTSSPEPAMLCACAERHLRHVLADAAPSQLLQTRNAEQKKEVSRSVQKRILDEFGLRVRILDWSRRPLEQETYAAGLGIDLVSATLEEEKRRIELTRMLGDRAQETQIEAAKGRLEQLKQLEELLGRALVAGDAPADVAALREQIAQLSEEQAKAAKEASKDRSHAVLPHLQSARDLLVQGIESSPPREGVAKKAKAAVPSTSEPKEGGR